MRSSYGGSPEVTSLAVSLARPKRVPRERSERRARSSSGSLISSSILSTLCLDDHEIRSVAISAGTPPKPRSTRSNVGSTGLAAGLNWRKSAGDLDVPKSHTSVA